MTTEYSSSLSAGLVYQQFIQQTLSQVGITITYYEGKEDQLKGESIKGWEVKNDKRMCETNNIYLETAEKSNPNKPTYYPSGIYREDNTKIYIIGDYKYIYVFNKTKLKEISRQTQYRRVQTPTSQGILLPISDAKKYCKGWFEVDGTGKINIKKAA
jgi:hypothetical protein